MLLGIRVSKEGEVTETMRFKRCPFPLFPLPNTPCPSASGLRAPYSFLPDPETSLLPYPMTLPRKGQKLGGVPDHSQEVMTRGSLGF